MTKQRFLKQALVISSSIAFLSACSPSNDDKSLRNETEINQALLGAKSKPRIEIDGLAFKDLNADGELNPYEDWRLPIKPRIADLIDRMTLEEKAGLMMHGSLYDAPNETGQRQYIQPKVKGALAKHIRSFVTRMSAPPEVIAKNNNQVQESAEASRLGIPVIMSTDPRNHFQFVLGASNAGVGFSQWPEPLGFAALGDAEVVEQFADIVRQEYRAVGIHMALSPQADLATEPRWPRQVATFGSTSNKVSPLVGAYVRGFQGSKNGLNSNGVATVTKHWAGYAASIDGWDAHNYYGRYVNLQNGALDEHMRAFEGAFEAKTSGIMPSYAIAQNVSLNGQALEEVGAGYSSQLLKEELRGRRGYDGVILSDWSITKNCTQRCSAPTEEAPQGIPNLATSWGVEELSIYQRFVKGVVAGLDQFGGVETPKYIIEAVEKGDIPEARLNESAKRVLALKFKMGLFENPYVDVDKASEVVGSEPFQALATQTQRSAQVLLENKDNLLPVSSELKNVWVYGMNIETLIAKGLNPVSDLDKAEFAIVRADAPSELLHPQHFFGQRQDEGRLDFQEGHPALEALTKSSAAVPTIFSVFLDRPAILSNISDKASAVLGNFGASDEALLDIVLGEAKPLGKLPVELPESMQAIEAQHPGLANDSSEPLYPAGYGLNY